MALHVPVIATTCFVRGRTLVQYTITILSFTPTDIVSSSRQAALLDLCFLLHTSNTLIQKPPQSTCATRRTSCHP